MKFLVDFLWKFIFREMQVSDRWESNFGSRPIWDVCLEPGSQRRVVFGCGSTLYLVNSANGEIESKYPNFHTDEIFTVGWTKDQDDKDVIASGAKDKHVIIWDLENDKVGFPSHRCKNCPWTCPRKFHTLKNLESLLQE